MDDGCFLSPQNKLSVKSKLVDLHIFVTQDLIGKEEDHLLMQKKYMNFMTSLP